MDKKIPCLDLSEQHRQLKTEIFHAFEKVYDSTAFSGGTFVDSFEKSFASYTGSRYAVGVCSGTAALHLAMLALNIGPGDEVILPANTFIATAWGISHAGATPVFADCDPLTWQLDPAKADAAITPCTKAIVGVHLYGQAFDVSAVKSVCDKHGIAFVEDAAQAQGTVYKGKMAGTEGDLACYSFYPGKNLGACGEAGAVITQDQQHASRLRSLRNHGSTRRYYHDEIGYNYRMGGLEAASLSVKLKYLDAWNNRRRQIAFRYRNEVVNNRLKFQQQYDGSDGIFHLFVCNVENRNDFVNYLSGNGIEPAFHYPVPCHLQKAYADLKYREGDCPNAEFLAAHCVSLPMFPELNDEDLDNVIEALNRY